MKLMSPNLDAAQLKNVDALLEEMLVDKPVTGKVFGSFISVIGSAFTNAANDVGKAVTSAATAVGHVVSSNTFQYAVANPVSALVGAVGSPVSVAETKPMIMKRKIVTVLKGNKAQALSLQELMMLRKEALN